MNISSQFNSDPIKNISGKLRENWNLLSPAVSWIMCVIGGFLKPPPTDTNFKNFLYLVTFLWVAIMFYFIFKWSSPKYGWLWLTVTFLSLVAVFLSVYGYFHIERSWTAIYSSRKVITGSKYMPIGKIYSAGHPEKPVEEIIKDFAGKIDMIWTKESINRRTAWMGSLYVLCGMLITTAMIASSQILYYASLSNTTTRRRSLKNFRL